MAAFCRVKEEFELEYGAKYGYDGTIDDMRRREFERLGDTIYLDNIAAAQYPKSLLDGYYKDISTTVYSNPHSGSPSSQCTTNTINEVRHMILKHFHTSSKEYSVIFTAGATASLRLLAESFDWQKGDIHGSCFCFLHCSHTSVVGIREVAAQYGAQILCVEDKDIVHLDSNSLLENELAEKYEKKQNCQYPCLFAYPAMCNFSGKKFPLEWTSDIKNGSLSLGDSTTDSTWFVMLDAASHISTSPLDLSVCPADYVPISFYKLFGFPTGLGALLVRNASASVLKKKYYGGGTVSATITSQRFHVVKPELDERFEDGTLPFLDIIALRHSFDALCKLTGSMECISSHAFSLASFVYHHMSVMTHGNGTPVCRMYCGTDFSSEARQGPVLNFNILRSDGSHVGYSEVGRLAGLRNIHLRTGCFCNTGACQEYLGLSNEKVQQNYRAGHVCGDQVDIVDGQPTGSVRISFGYMSSFSDAWHFVDFVRSCFVEKHPEIRSNRGNMMETATPYLKEICVYPIKSCAAFKVDRWQISSRGFLYDRQWMIVNESGSSAVSQKREPRVCLIKPTIDLSRGIMRMTAADVPPLEIPLQQPSAPPSEDVKVLGKRVHSIDCGDEAAEWLSKMFRKNYRLVQQTADDGRACGVAGNKHSLSLANTSQYLLVSEQSAEVIHTHLRNNLTEPGMSLDVENILARFRGNFVISGAQAFAEDNWRKLRIGAELFTFQSKCVRCQMVGHDQESGEKTTEPLSTLAKIRRNQTTTFGINVNHLPRPETETQGQGTWINVGAQVQILEVA